MNKIYFDNAATTRIDSSVLKTISTVMQDNYGNPSSTHSFGRSSRTIVEKARKSIAEEFNVSTSEIFFTSGGTESDNMVLISAVRDLKVETIITSKVEHHAVLNVVKYLEKTNSIKILYVKVDKNGCIDYQNLEQILNSNKSKTLVSLMHINNEIGVINDIEAIGRLTREHDVIFHVDAAQSTGKLPIDLSNLEVDLMSFSAHKTYGPKGIGAMYARRKPRVRLEAQIHGGGHERGMRSGTLATHQIVGMGEAFRIAKLDMDSDNKRIRFLRDKFWKGLEGMEEVYLNGDLEQRAAGFLNVSFNHVEGESLIMALKDIAVSSGSACTSASLEPSYVLRAIGLKDELAHSSIRFAIGRFTTEEEVDYTIELVKDSVDKLRQLSPLWDMYKDGVDLDSVEWASD